MFYSGPLQSSHLSIDIPIESNTFALLPLTVSCSAIFPPAVTNGVAADVISTYSCHLLEAPTASRRHPWCSSATFVFITSLQSLAGGTRCWPLPSYILLCHLHLHHEPDRFATISTRTIQPLFDWGSTAQNCKNLFSTEMEMK